MRLLRSPNEPAIDVAKMMPPICLFSSPTAARRYFLARKIWESANIEIVTIERMTYPLGLKTILLANGKILSKDVKRKFVDRTSKRITALITLTAIGKNRE